eukprot:scaffold31109_cov175-Amphora_coffeaeformis.AAC.6
MHSLSTASTVGVRRLLLSCTTTTGARPRSMTTTTTRTTTTRMIHLQCHTRRAGWWCGGGDGVSVRNHYWNGTPPVRRGRGVAGIHRRALTTTGNFKANNKNNVNNKKKDDTLSAPKKNKSHLSASSTAGRIAIQEPYKNSKKQSKKTRVCSGCGAAVVSGKDGQEYGGQIFSTGTAAVDKNASKKEAKQARYFDFGDRDNSSTFLCQRCKKLNANDIWSAYDAIRDVDASVFQAQLKHIVARRKFGMCIVVADATDPEHSAPKHLRRIIGSTPIILVLTKADLVPRLGKRDVRQLESKIAHIMDTRSFLETFRVSAVTGAGIFQLAEYLLLNIRGRDIFVVGAANVGKSTLVQRLAQEITPNIYLRDKRTAVKRKKKMTTELHVTASHLPGTTLQAVRVPCFASPKHALWDTPGMIQNKAIQYSLFPPHLMEPLARAERIELADSVRVRAGQTILIEAAWMDEVEKTEKENDEQGDKTENTTTLSSSGYNDGGNNNTSSCVLGRLDVIDVSNGQRGYGGRIVVRPFLHPSLRLRIVPTNDQVPEHATIPQHYIQLVQSRMRKAFPKDSTTSLPLAPFTTPQNPEGFVKPTDKERNHDGRVYVDISFASLGWLAMAMYDERADFTIKPWVVTGSIFSKRRGLYPMNMSEDDVEDSRNAMREEALFLDTEEARERLDAAAKKGRKSAGMQSNEDDDENGTEIWLDDDDEWY